MTDGFTHEVYQVLGKHSVPKIGQGGITTPTDTLEFMIAGAAGIGIEHA